MITTPTRLTISNGMLSWINALLRQSYFLVYLSIMVEHLLIIGQFVLNAYRAPGKIFVIQAVLHLIRPVVKVHVFDEVFLSPSPSQWRPKRIVIPSAVHLCWLYFTSCRCFCRVAWVITSDPVVEIFWDIISTYRSNRVYSCHSSGSWRVSCTRSARSV